LTKTLENADTLLALGSLTTSFSSVSVSRTWWGWSDLRFLRTKKPASVAERNIRINLSGHISCQSRWRTERERIEKCVEVMEGAVEVLSNSVGHGFTFPFCFFSLLSGNSCFG
jgi:hypothetical protein